MSKPDKDEAKHHIEATAGPVMSWGPRKRRAEVKVEKIETEADKQLKDQIKKQLHTDVTLESELRKKKTFTSPSVYDPLKVSGTLSLKNYQNVSQDGSRRQELRNCKLTEEEIEIKLNHEKGLLLNSTGFGADPIVKETALKAIDEKIEKHEKSVLETSSFTGAKKLGRHEMDLEKALTQSRDKEKSKVSEMLLTGKHTDHVAIEEIPNPVKGMLMEIERKIYKNQVKESESSMDESSSESETETINIPEGSVLNTSTNCEECDKLRTKNRYFVGPLLKTEYDYYEQCESCKQLRNKEYNERAVISRKVATKSKSSVKRKKKKVKKKKNTKKQETDVTDTNSRATEVEEMSKSVASIPTEAIIKYRLTAEQIKEIPHFVNYSAGEPHNTLYLKNLSNKVTEDDLKSLFCQFESYGPVQYRLLAGRMRGQAFVTFKDISTATRALELLHGYSFKGKPVIIQYGKKQT